uniref:Uncharacterized protein n=1 Tax=Palmaria palmata TaxID=2822 RepID=A0A1C9CHB4_PALPL|nr:hypothetical protein Palma_123 [Palmaria palmata]AOM67755.1 hypothetical protein Palma_123 [Palmaria palmata]
MTDITLDQQFQDLCGLFNKKDNTSKLIQLRLSKEIMQYGPEGEIKLISILRERLLNDRKLTNYVDGSIYELLLNSEEKSTKLELHNSFPNGVIPLKSNLGIDYTKLQQLLTQKKFQEADSLTQFLLCKLSQITKGHSRSWLYFTDVRYLPVEDLQTIDQLWQIHSMGLFGLSVQRKIWLASNTNWDKFWCKIGWTKDNSTCRYPKEFTWNINAPAGHLPLFNQLRGVQVLAALFEHPAWIE